MAQQTEQNFVFILRPEYSYCNISQTHQTKPSILLTFPFLLRITPSDANGQRDRRICADLTRIALLLYDEEDLGLELDNTACICSM